MRRFLRKMRARDPLAVTMSGIRMGERVLQVGLNDPNLAGALVAKVGLSGHAAIAVASEDAAARARRSAADAAALADVHVTRLDALPFAPNEFDVVVIHGADGLLSAIGADVRAGLLRECFRVLRSGGRLLAIEAGARTGLSALLRSQPAQDPAYAQAGGALAALEAAGFRPARVLGDTEGLMFTEGFRGGGT